MLSLLALESGVESFDGADMDAIWEKSIRLFDLFPDTFHMETMVRLRAL